MEGIMKLSEYIGGVTELMVEDHFFFVSILEDSLAEEIANILAAEDDQLDKFLNDDEFMKSIGLTRVG